MADIKKLVQDKDKAVNGVWVHINIPGWEGAEIKLASQRTREFQFYVAKGRKPKSAGEFSKVEDFDPAEIYEISMENMASKIILDWKGITNGDEEFPCSYENAVKLLDACPEFYDFVVVESRKMDHFRPDVLAAAEESLGKS